MSVGIQLGQLQQITDLRAVWQNEAQDFTPWVANNLSLLNDATGLNLGGTVEQESPVGSFSVDILTQDLDSGANVIIENQLEDTNHDHLGKLITYATGKDAKIIIWVVKSAREEHRAAIEWLNNNTVDGIGFFLVEIQLWSINGSVLAPKFDVIEQPNGWSKAAKSSNTQPGGAAVQFKYNFWSAFNDYAFSDALFSGTFKKKRASSDHWYTLHRGKGCELNLLVNTSTDTITVEVNIRDDKALFDNMFSHKDTIETALGTAMDWRRLDNKKASRILLENSSIDLHDETQRNLQFDWYKEWASKIRAAFKPYARWN